MAQITTQARRLTRQHNNEERLVSGYIYWVDLHTGRIGGLAATYAADQIKPGDPEYGKWAIMRVGHGRLSEKGAQRFLNDKGKGW